MKFREIFLRDQDFCILGVAERLHSDTLGSNFWVYGISGNFSRGIIFFFFLVLIFRPLVTAQSSKLCVQTYSTQNVFDTSAK